MFLASAAPLATVFVFLLVYRVVILVVKSRFACDFYPPSFGLRHYRWYNTPYEYIMNIWYYYNQNETEPHIINEMVVDQWDIRKTIGTNMPTDKSGKRHGTSDIYQQTCIIIGLFCKRCNATGTAYIGFDKWLHSETRLWYNHYLHWYCSINMGS